MNTDLNRTTGVITQPSTSHLFLVRVWAGDSNDQTKPFTGKVQHVLSGEARDFSDWATLESILASMVPPAQEGDTK